VCVGDVLFWRRLEEEKLEAEWGEEYREYQKRSWF
jgi:protein-S-isoprenylcysteine O-methyltransferase Ste14